MNAPTPVTTTPVASITANLIQADSTTTTVNDTTGVISATVVVSFFALVNNVKVFARTPAGAKITYTISVPDVSARATKRVGQGSNLMATWLNDSLALIPDELARVQAEQAAVVAAQQVVAAAQAKLATDKTALASPDVLVADIAAIGTAQTALTAAQTAAQ